MEKVTVKDFEMIKEIGFGAFGIVFLARKTASHHDLTPYAMKILKYTEQPNIMAQARSERDNLIEIDSPFVVQLEYAFFSAKTAYFVMEYCEGGTLLELVNARRPVSQEQARFYLAELLIGLQHLHDKDIVHRDLRLENIMLKKNGHIKIIDFGLSIKLEKNEKCNKLGRTFSCQSPEIHEKMDYDEKAADIWAYGAIFFEILTSRNPFCDKNQKKTYWNIKNMSLAFTPFVHHDAQDLMSKILTSETLRIKIEQIKTHCFFDEINWNTVAACGLSPPFVFDGVESSNETGVEIIGDVQNQEVDSKINDEFYYARP